MSDFEVEAFSVEAAQQCDVVLMAVSGGFSTERLSRRVKEVKRNS